MPPASRCVTWLGYLAELPGCVTWQACGRGLFTSEPYPLGGSHVCGGFRDVQSDTATGLLSCSSVGDVGRVCRTGRGGAAGSGKSRQP